MVPSGPIGYARKSVRYCPDRQSLGAAVHASQLHFERVLQGPAPEKLVKSAAGKLVILEFWATWCAPCVAAIPHLNALAERFSGDKVVFIAVTNESPDRVTRFLSKRTMNSWVALDSSMFREFDVQVLPTTIVIARSGSVALRTIPDALTNEVIQDLLRGKQYPAVVPARPAETDVVVPQPLFQIVVSPSKGREETYGFDLTKGIFTADAIRAQTLFGFANDFTATRVLGPQSILDRWLSVKCRVPEGYDLREALRQTLPAALGVHARREVREISAYRLRAGPAGAFGVHPSVAGTPPHLSTDVGLILAVDMDISSLCSELENVVGTPVLDETNLTAKYDWDLQYQSSKPADVKAALAQQLGLDMVPSTAAVEVVVVETAATNH